MAAKHYYNKDVKDITLDEAARWWESFPHLVCTDRISIPKRPKTKPGPSTMAILRNYRIGEAFKTHRRLFSQSSRTKISGLPQLCLSVVGGELRRQNPLWIRYQYLHVSGCRSPGEENSSFWLKKLSKKPATTIKTLWKQRVPLSIPKEHCWHYTVEP